MTDKTAPYPPSANDVMVETIINVIDDIKNGADPKDTDEYLGRILMEIESARPNSTAGIWVDTIRATAAEDLALGLISDQQYRALCALPNTKVNIAVWQKLQDESSAQLRSQCDQVNAMVLADLLAALPATGSPMSHNATVVVEPQALRAELMDAPGAHNLLPEDAAEIINMDDAELIQAINTSLNDAFWAAYDSVRRDAIARLIREHAIATIED